MRASRGSEDIPPCEIWNIRLSESAFMRFDGSMIRKQTVKSKLKKKLILLKLLHFKIDFWWGGGGGGAETTHLCILHF